MDGFSGDNREMFEGNSLDEDNSSDEVTRVGQCAYHMNDDYIEWLDDRIDNTAEGNEHHDEEIWMNHMTVGSPMLA